MRVGGIQPPDRMEVVFRRGFSRLRSAADEGRARRLARRVFDDHVKRVFRANTPNRVWLTDITEHRTTTEGKLYLLRDQGRVLEPDRRLFDLGSDDREHPAVDALRNAVARRW